MIDLEIGDAEIIARGSAGPIAISVAGWNPIEEAGDIEIVPVDVTCSGYLSKFQLSTEIFDSPLMIRSLDGDIRDVEGIDESDIFYHGEAIVSKSVTLPKGKYQLKKVIGMVTIYSVISGPAKIHIGGYQNLSIIPTRPTLVTFGFRDNNSIASETVTVPMSARGLATAISYFQTGLSTQSPDRSFLTFRTPPPNIDFGTLDIPSSIERSDRMADIEIVCPDRIETVAATASVAYYLGATVKVDDVDNSVLRIGDGEFELPFSKMPDFQLEIGNLLKLVLWLDSVGRGLGEYGKGLENLHIRDLLEIEPDRLYDMTAEDRLMEYLTVDYGEIADQFPPWSLGIRIDTNESDLKMLPDLAKQLAIIYPSKVDISDSSPRIELLRTSGPSDERLFGISTSLDTFEEPSEDGIFHLHLRPLASRFYQPEKNTIGITIVRNDDSPNDSFSSFFRERISRLKIPCEINKLSSVPRDELKALVQNPTDFLIFVGDTKNESLGCQDGYLPMEEINTIGAEFFMVDAPDSIDIGFAAAELGVRTAIVGTDTNEWNGIGPAPIGFSLLGFGLADATRLACNFTDSTESVSVIGDGMATHRATSGTGMGILQLSDEPSLSLSATFLPIFPGTDQILYSTPGFAGGNKLAGNVYTRQVSPENLAGTIEVLKEPIIYSDDLYWPEERFQLINAVI